MPEQDVLYCIPMTYCIRCGGELIKITNTKYECTKCKRSQFNNPKGAVALLIFDGQDRVILTRRAHEPDKDKLDPIGGFIDYGENAETALFRELKEETALDEPDITKPSYIYSGYQEYDWHGMIEPLVSMWFWADLTAEKPLNPQDDVSAFETFQQDDIPTGELASPRAIAIINHAFELKQRQQ